MDIYVTSQGELNGLRTLREAVAGAKDPLDIICVTQGALSHLSSEVRSKLQSTLTAESTLEQAHAAVAVEFEQFCSEQERILGPQAEQERQEALSKLQQYAETLRDPRQSTYHELMRIWMALQGDIEHTEDDKTFLNQFDHSGSNVERSRRALLSVVEAHLASGVAGKFWI